MRMTSLERQRRWFGRALLAGSCLGIVWFFSPGLPVWFGPWASAATKQAGRELFIHEWTASDPLAHGDGLGPVFNARSCAACHFQGGVGGAGSRAQNILNFEVVPNRRDTQLVSGTIHGFAVNSSDRESLEQVRQRYPIIKGGKQTVQSDGCSYVRIIQDVDPVRPQTLQPTALFGAGWIDRISSRAITSHLMAQAAGNVVKELKLDWSAVPPGRERVLPDGRVGKFGWKAQFATLEEFVAAACANELGLGTPLRPQAQPFSRPDGKVPADLDKSQFKALVAFVDTLPRPVEDPPADAVGYAKTVRGKELFTSIGCTACHTPDLGGVHGVYSDFLLHILEDPSVGGSSYGPEPPSDVPLPEDHPKQTEWRTPPLWGVADSAPYLHDGSAATLRDAVLRHGGDAKLVRDAYKKLKAGDQEAVLSFLATLKAPPDAQPINTAVSESRKR
jgi:mono/diheme cytochrome c family protein